MKFLKDFEKIQKISRKLNFRLLKAAKVHKSVFNSSISIGLCDLQTLVSCNAVLPLNHVQCDLTVVKVVHGESMAACVHLFRR